MFLRPYSRRSRELLIALALAVGPLSFTSSALAASQGQVLAVSPSISGLIVTTDPSVQAGATITWVQTLAGGAHAVMASTKDATTGRWSPGQAIVSGPGRFAVQALAASPSGNVAVLWTVGNALDMAVRRNGVWSAATLVATLPATPETPHTFITNLLTVDDAGAANAYWSLYDFNRRDQEVELTTVTPDGVLPVQGTGSPATIFSTLPIATAAMPVTVAGPPNDPDSVPFGYHADPQVPDPIVAAADGSAAVLFTSEGQVGGQTLFLVRRRSAAGAWGPPQALNAPSTARFNVEPKIVGGTDWYSLTRNRGRTKYTLSAAPLPSSTSPVRIDVPAQIRFTRAQLKKTPYFPFTAGLDSSGYVVVGSFRAAGGTPRALKMSKREVACAVAYGSASVAGPGRRAHLYGGIYRYQPCGEKLLKRLATPGPDVAFTLELGGAAVGHLVARKTVRIVVDR